MNTDVDYASYLLRLRRVRSGAQPVWLVSVQCTATGKRGPYTELAEFIRFLQATYGGSEQASAPPAPAISS